MDEFKNIMPDLDGHLRNRPFRVPDGYFESLSGKINDKISARKSQPVHYTIIRTLKPYMAAAAMILVFLVSGRLVYNYLQSGKSADYPDTEISQLVDQELYSIPESTIIEVMNSDQVQKTPSGISTNDAVDYLIDENTDVEQLIDSN